MQLGHARIETREKAVVVPRIAVVATEAQCRGEALVASGHQAALRAGDHLGGAEAEHLGRPKAADRPATSAASQGMSGVVHHGDSGALGQAVEALDLTWRAVDMRRHGAVAPSSAFSASSASRVRLSA